MRVPRAREPVARSRCSSIRGPRQLAGADGHEIAKRLDARFPPMELWLALRVAYLDRLVGLAVDRLSIRQVVILGAGYDTRAARLPRAGVTFFEVDHPATQAAKRERLAKLAGLSRRCGALRDVQLRARGSDRAARRERLRDDASPRS